jgi:hypothetical protein
VFEFRVPAPPNAGDTQNIEYGKSFSCGHTGHILLSSLGKYFMCLSSGCLPRQMRGTHKTSNMELVRHGGSRFQLPVPTNSGVIQETFCSVYYEVFPSSAGLRPFARPADIKVLMLVFQLPLFFKKCSFEYVICSRP